MKRASLRPFEIAGLVVFVAISCALVLSVWFAVRDRRNRSICGSNLRQVHLSTMQYVRDYDELYPPADKWQTVLWPYSKSTVIFNCPSARSGGYAMNKYFSMMRMSLTESTGIYERMPLYFETHLSGINCSGGPEAWLNSRRHAIGVWAIFSSGGSKILQAPPPRQAWASPGMLNPPLSYWVGWGFQVKGEVTNRP